jgi:putative membrane protein
MISNAALNACLNGLSGVLLACGYAAIRAGKKGVHKAFMLSAVSVSSLFLISYLTYHIRVGKAVLFQGQGWIRPAYFTLLASHTILAATIVPLIIVTLRRAWLGRFDKHRLIARWTLPLWFYVSVTGVIIYLMVYQIFVPKIP